MALAEVPDLEVDFGPISVDQVDQVEVLLERAEEQVRQAVPNLDQRIALGWTTAGLAGQVVCEMVAGVLRNPEGYRSTTRSDTKGPFSESRSGTFSADVAPGRLTLTRRHMKLLGTRTGAQTVPVGDPALARPLVAPDEDRYRGDGYVWPDHGLPTP